MRVQFDIGMSRTDEPMDPERGYSTDALKMGSGVYPRPYHKNYGTICSSINSIPSLVDMRLIFVTIEEIIVF